MSPNPSSHETDPTARLSEIPSALRRRRDAALRLQPYDRHGHRDPRTTARTLGDLAAWRAAERHLASLGLDSRWVRRDAMARGAV